MSTMQLQEHDMGRRWFIELQMMWLGQALSIAGALAMAIEIGRQEENEFREQVTKILGRFGRGTRDVPQKTIDDLDLD